MIVTDWVASRLSCKFPLVFGSISDISAAIDLPFATAISYDMTRYSG